MIKQVIILLGKSGSGKGTQAELLKKKLGFSHVVSGDLLRNRAKKSDFTAKKLTVTLARGNLVPTSIIYKLWLDRLERLQNTKNVKGVILDGNPRKIQEACLIDEALDWYGYQKVKVVLIDISDKEAVFRLGKRRLCSNKKCGNIIPFTNETKDMTKCPKCGRKLIARNDDMNSRAVKERLKWFKTEVHPIVEYYKKTGRLYVVDGKAAISKVFQGVLKAIK